MNRIISIALVATALAAACASKEDAKKPSTTKCMVECNDPEHPICDPVRQQCFGCLKDTDCNLRPLGTACVQAGNFCGCNTNDDCMASTIGGKCLSTHACGCDENVDCAGKAGPACLKSTHACGCAADTDCTSLSAKHCNVPTGECDACFSNAMCPDPDLAACKPDDHTCVPCLAETDCSKNTYGPHCMNGGCQCSADGECAASPRGPHCQVSGAQKVCGCAMPAECASSALGSKCVQSADPAVSSCGCAADTDCVAPQTCDLVYARCKSP